MDHATSLAAVWLGSLLVAGAGYALGSIVVTGVGLLAVTLIGVTAVAAWTAGPREHTLPATGQPERLEK